MPEAYATLEDLKTHAGIPATGSDTLLQAYLDAAQAWCDQYTNSTFTEQTATDERYDGQGNRYIRLRNRPVIAVSAVKVDDVTVESSTYVLDDLGHLVVPEIGRGASFDYDPRIHRDGDGDLGYQPVWPSGTGNIKVTYTYGYSAVPAGVSMACALLAAHWYLQDKRGSVQSQSMGPRSITYQSSSQATSPVLALLNGYIQLGVGG